MQLCLSLFLSLFCLILVPFLTFWCVGDPQFQLLSCFFPLIFLVSLLCLKTVQ